MATRNQHVTMKDYPSENKPIERLRSFGKQALTNQEIVGILLNSGTREKSAVDLAGEVCSAYNLNDLKEITIEELTEIKGIGIVKAARILAAVELAERIFSTRVEEKPGIGSPQDVSDLVMEEMRNFDKEYFRILLLNTKNKVISMETISIGILNSSLAHPREIFKKAIKRSAASIILIHNHPSGDPTPSREDIALTKNLEEISKIIKIKIFDHIIIGNGKYYSMKENGVF